MGKLFLNFYKSTFTIFLLFPTFIFAQPRLDFEYFTVDNGLSRSSVFSITQDKQGFMWFGTNDGVNKFNGHNFEIYRTEDAGKDYILALQADKNGDVWIGTRKGLRKYIYSSDSFLEINNNPQIPNNIDGDIINCIYKSPDNNIWVGTDKGLNKLIDNKQAHFQQLSKEIKGLGPVGISAIYQDSFKDLWVGTSEGLAQITNQNGTYSVKKHFISENRNTDRITAIIEDNQHNLWIGTKNEGIILYNRKLKTVTRFNRVENDENSLINNSIRKIIKDKQGNLWIATLKGLCVLKPDTRIFKAYTHSPEERMSLNHNSIYDVFIDNQGSIWIGTYYGGINVSYAKTTLFQNLQAESSQNSLSSNVISTILEDNKNLWIGTEAEGLNYLDYRTKKFTHFKHNSDEPTSLSSDLVNTIYKDKQGRLWIGVVGGGLNLMSADGKSFTHFKHQKEIKTSISSNNVSSMLEDDEGRFWVGTMGGGLNLFNPKNKTFTVQTDTNKINPLSSNWVKVIFKDSKQNLWIGTHNGINLLKKGSKSFKWFLKSNSGLTSNLITSITESSDGKIWVGTNYGGLNVLDPKTNKFHHYSNKDGLPSNNVMAIIEDNDHLLWISTDKGISCFDIKDKIFRNYNRKDGLPGNVFNLNSSLKTKEGKIYFGSYSGLVCFFPKDIQRNNTTYPVVFTGLTLFNEKVVTNANDGILKKNISETKKIDLAYNQNTFTLQFSSLNLIKSFKNQYAYKLEGTKNDWEYTTSPSITYTNLSVGTYTVLVKSANNDGVWSQQPSKIIIRIMPPFWKTWWAYMFYTLTFGILVYIVVKFLNTRSKLKRDLYYEHLENSRQQTHLQLQMDFFTNISHELRTPLTLIIGPLENASREVPEGSPLDRYLSLASKNAKLLLKLVNELMDFRKTEVGQMKLRLSWYSFPDFIQNTFEFFSNEAIDRNINYQLKIDSLVQNYYFDKDQLEKVIVNLLSNAFKFTPNYGDIQLRVDQNDREISITIEDNGEGIPSENLEILFTKFYQIETQGYRKNSSGVGLALAKAIVELHEGKITVESNTSNNNEFRTKFIVKLPLTEQTASTMDMPVAEKQGETQVMITKKRLSELAEKDVEEEILTSTQEAKLTVLLIEDNTNMREFIRDEIASVYHVVEANDGQQGLEKALKIIPDMIISDSMMPIMDGLELCHKIKTNEATAHIPFILLTAKSEDSNKIEGLETGANVYITKPFSTKWLLLNMNNLMVAREAIRQRFGKKISLEPHDVEITSGDEKFILKLIAIIENNLESAELGVAMLTQKIGMSKNVLYRKVNALTGLSVGDFIKSIKLKKAAILLEKRHLSIEEITFYAGFNDPKYFGKEFKKYFGKSPSQYRNELNSTEE